MRLLVSVQNQEEARAACAGGAAIIDAKDPGRGALGPVSRDTLREIRAIVPREIPVSAALGDVSCADELRQSLADLPSGIAFVKIGFSALDDAAEAEELLSQAVALTQRIPDAPRVVAVAYADSRQVGGLALEGFPALIQRAKAHGLLLDTSIKNGRPLPDHIPPDDLVALGAALASRGLSYALGGSLTLRDIPLARAARADIIGVRGAVTVGGRSDSIDTRRVAAFADALRGCLAPSAG